MTISKHLAFRLVAFMAAILVAGCTGLQPTTSAVTIVSAEFGLFRPPWGARHFFEPTNVVPNRVGQPYGWQIRVNTDLKTIRWKEEFVLPEAPKYWGDNQKTPQYTVSEDRRISTTERAVPNNGGMLFNLWEVAPDDPKGNYEMRVYIEDQLVRVFKFVVE